MLLLSPRAAPLDLAVSRGINWRAVNWVLGGRALGARKGPCLEKESLKREQEPGVQFGFPEQSLLL